jgi:DNA polymerase
VVATVHPSSILRQPDSRSRDEALAAFVSDLAVVAGLLERGDYAFPESRDERS